MTDMKLPVMPPVAPMLAKSVPTIPPTGSVRAEVGRLPVGHLPRRRRGRDRQPQRAADDALLPRTGRGVPRRAARAVRRGRRDRHRHRHRSGLRGAAAAHPSCGVPGEPARRADAGVVHRLRPARPRRGGPHRTTGSRTGGRGSSRRWPSSNPPVHVTPATTDRDTAQRWFAEFEGAGLDGVVAKPLDGTYQPDKRVMFKIKHERTADCVVAGYRVHKSRSGRGRLAAAGPLHRRRVARVGRGDRRLPDGPAP